MLLTRRLIQLFAGLILYGLAIALLVRADVGLDPWDVLHQGLAERTGLPFGLVVNGLGVLILLMWIPLRERPGVGTVANVLVIGVVAEFAMRFIATPDGWLLRWLMFAAGIVGNGIATGAYVGAGLGPGPRDGLMTGIVRRTGWPVKYVRTAIEVAVVAIGWLLGGSVGLGTVVYALTIGPCVHVFLPMFTIGRTEAPRA